MLRNKYLHIKYEDLTPENVQELRRAGVLNGFGGARQSKIIRFFLSIILRKFNIAIAQKHDYSYHLGITPREVCDEKFFQAMVKDMYNIYKKDGKKMMLCWNLFLCLVSYYSIRIFGNKFYGSQ